MTWRYFKEYMTFRYDSNGNLDPMMLHAQDDITRDEHLGVLSLAQINQLYELPHTPDDPATMDIALPDGRKYRVVRFNLVRCRTKDTGIVYRPSRKRVGFRYYKDVDRGYLYAYPWYGPFPKEGRGTIKIPSPQPVVYGDGHSSVQLIFEGFHNSPAGTNGIRDCCHSLSKGGFGVKGFCWCGNFVDEAQQWLYTHSGKIPAPPAWHMAVH